METTNASTNSAVEEGMIKCLNAVSSAIASSADKTVALYVAGMSARKVSYHIKQRTFSGARAIHHITAPDTAEARSAWRRGKDACRRAGLPIRRSNWTEKPDEDLYDLNKNDAQINKTAVHDTSIANVILYPPTQTPARLAESKLGEPPEKLNSREAVSDLIDTKTKMVEKPSNTEKQKAMIRQREFWETIFRITKEENIKILDAKLAGPADILEAQLQPILWYCLRTEGIVSVVESSFDPQNIRKKLDMIFESQGEHYIVEIKRNGLGLENHGKTYTDSIDRFQDDFDKLNSAQFLLGTKFKTVKKIFIEIQYFESWSRKYDSHRTKFKDLIKNQSSDWVNGCLFEFGGPRDIIYASKGEISIAMRILIAN